MDFQCVKTKTGTPNATGWVGAVDEPAALAAINGPPPQPVQLGADPEDIE